MINWIGSWVQGIVIAVVISTIIEMILPDGNIKKYVRTVIGVYIVFVIISPIITKITGKEINLKTYELPKTTIVQQNVIDTNAYIESTYINKLKQDIIEKIEAKGYKVININIGIEQKETGYGNINKIDLKISKISGVGKVQVLITYSETSEVVAMHNEVTNKSRTEENDTNRRNKNNRNN